MSLSLPHGTGDGGRESLCGRGALIVRRPALSSGAGDPHHKEACGGSGGWGGRGRVRRVRSNRAKPPHTSPTAPPSPFCIARAHPGDGPLVLIFVGEPSSYAPRVLAR